MGQLFGLGLSMLMSREADSASSAQDAAARAAAAQAAEDRQRQQYAANLLQESNQAYSQLNPPAAQPSAASPTAVVSSLLDEPAPAQDGTAAVVGLLGDGGPTATGSNDTTESVAALLSSSSPPPTDGTPPPSGAEPGIGTAPSSLPPDIAPPDPAINAVLQESADEPAPALAQSLPQTLQSDAAQATDGLGDLISPHPVLAGDLASDPVIQSVAAHQGNLLTVPTPAAGDSPDAAADKVFGQATTGFGALLRGMAGGPFAFSKALYGYGTKMVNQLGGELGMANASIFESQQADPHP